MNYTAEIRCMFCNCRLGHKHGFTEPNQTSHGIGECCTDFAIEWWTIKR